jgi:hypothetical protein
MAFISLNPAYLSSPRAMFANLHQLFRKNPPHDDRGFVQEVNVRPPRNRRTEKLLWWMWALIVIKNVFVVWLVRHYAMPFGAQWVTIPTLVFGFVCTAVYWWRS